jgi:hypothetical protein
MSRSRDKPSLMDTNVHDTEMPMNDTHKSGSLRLAERERENLRLLTKHGSPALSQQP